MDIKPDPSNIFSNLAGREKNLDARYSSTATTPSAVTVKATVLYSRAHIIWQPVRSLRRSNAVA